MASSRPVTKVAASFAGLPLPSSLLASVRRVTKTLTPLPIQQAAARRVFQGESVAIHSQTGSGKTLAFMLPLLARLKHNVPRQVLMFVPTRELALQSFEYARLLRPSSSALLPASTKPRVLREALRHENAPVLIGTAGQLAALHKLFAPEPQHCAVLDGLRRTLRTVVIDESDAILEPLGKGYMLNRARRNRALYQMPQALALRRLVERRRDATHRRIQLVVASATVSKRTMRDLATLVGRAPGKMGLVAPGMAAAEAERLAIGGGAGGGSVEGGVGADWEARLANLEAEEAAEAAQAQVVAAAPVVVRGGEGAVARGGGFGVRGGVLDVGVPDGIAHEVVVCRQRRKSDIIAAIVAPPLSTRRRQSRRGGGDGRASAADAVEGAEEAEEAERCPAIVVVRDDLPAASVVEELERVGIRGVVDLSSLGDAAWRHHGLANAADDANAAPVAEAAPPPPPPPLPSWAVPRGVLADEAASEAALRRRERMEGDLDDDTRPDEAAVPAAGEGRDAAVGASMRQQLAAAIDDGTWRVLVAHESALRGLDMPSVRTVILTMMPSTPEAYVHLAGRTGRAGGARGKAVCVFTEREFEQGGAITRALRGVRWRVVRDDQ